MLTLGLSFYWFMYWLLNGMAKILDGHDFGLFIWSGKNRTSQFAEYLEGLGWSGDMGRILIFALFIVEILIALAFLRAIVSIYRHRAYGGFMPQETIKFPVLISIMCFTGFSIWDAIAGDRADLWEHGTYIVALGITWVIASFESILDIVPQTKYQGTDRRSNALRDRRSPSM